MDNRDGENGKESRWGKNPLHTHTHTDSKEILGNLIFYIITDEFEDDCVVDFIVGRFLRKLYSSDLMMRNKGNKKKVKGKKTKVTNIATHGECIMCAKAC